MCLLQLFKVSGEGDVGLVVNGQAVMTAEAALDDTKAVEAAAERLATALDVALQVVEIDVKGDLEWTWESVLAKAGYGEEAAHAAG